MKKIVLSIAAVMAAAAFAPEASAVPVFARQTGMACSACHFQHFPLLNGFGRAFKTAGFTMMGAQAKVEGEHLDIPGQLNMGVLTTTGYETVSNGIGSTTGKSSNWFVPGSGGELSIFFGGRVSEFAGFLSELGLGSKTIVGGKAGTGVGAAKLALLFPVGDSRIGLVAHTSDGQGVAYSYETLNTGAVNTHKMTALNMQGGSGAMTNGGPNGHTGVYSAGQYLGTNTAATGLSFVAANDNMGFINIGKYESAGIGAGNAGSLPLTYVRVAGLFEAAGFDMGAGVQSFSGTSVAVVGQQVKATVLDFQAQGEVSGMGLGIYTSYATAPANLAGTNALNVANVNTKKSFGIGAELGVVPGVATVQLAFRSAKNGAAAGVDGDNAIQVGGTYELAQNIELSLTHTSSSGSAWNAASIGKSVTTLMMEALF